LKIIEHVNDDLLSFIPHPFFMVIIRY